MSDRGLTWREMQEQARVIGYEQAVGDAQDALTGLLASSSTLFSDLQGLRAALIVVQRLSPDTNESERPPNLAESV